MSREGIPLLVIQHQLGHTDLAITSTYPRGTDNTEINRTYAGRIWLFGGRALIPAAGRFATSQ